MSAKHTLRDTTSSIVAAKHVLREHGSRPITPCQSRLSPSLARSCTPLAHLQYAGDRHPHPERLPSARRERTVSARLTDVSKVSIDTVRGSANSLKRLMLDRMNITSLPEQLVNNLQQLERLNLGYNMIYDQGLPECVKKLDKLVEVTLNNNRLTRVPVCLQKLRHLARLDVSHNKIDDVKGIEKIKRLQILVIDNNCLTSIIKETSSLKKLEILNASYNNINHVPTEIKNMKLIKELDLGHNRITNVPQDLFLLPRLDFLNINQNRISKIPTFSVRLQNRHWVSHIDLSENSISKFPEHLLLMANKLDLTSNKLKVITGSIIKKLDWNFEMELLLEGNPFTYPPVDICDCGFRAVIQFFQDAQSDSKVYQGVKMHVVGSHRGGKTSLVQSLIDQQTRLEEPDNDTIGVDIFEATLDANPDDDRSLQLCIFDYSGHPFYKYPQYLLNELPAITLLAFNMAEYSNWKFEAMIGSWLDWMLTKTNKLIVIIVGTQSDKLTGDKIKHLLHDVQSEVRHYMRDRKRRIEAEIKKIEEKSHISSTLSEQLKTYMGLLNVQAHIYPNVLSTSSATFTGFKELKTAIEDFGFNKEIFPNVMRVIPTFWLEVEHYIEDKGNLASIPVMSWDEYEEEVTKKFGMRTVLPIITQYLHDTGRVLWFTNNPILHEYVFIRPSWVFDLLKGVFNHKYETKINYLMDESYKQAGLSERKVDMYRKELLTQGVMDKDLLKCLLAPVLTSDLNQPFQQVAALLVQAFEIGISCVADKTDKSEYSFHIRPDSDGQTRISKIMFPWLRTTLKPDGLSDKRKLIQGQKKLVTHYVFPKYMPPGLFESLVTKIGTNEEMCSLQLCAVWGGGFHATHRQLPIDVVMSSTVNGDKVTTMKIDVRDRSDRPFLVISKLWAVMMPILLVCEESLQDFTGIWVCRHIECQKCGNPSFPGEWMSPKETQLLTTKKCDTCGQSVDTTHLVQPREKKREDIMKRLSDIRFPRRTSDAVIPTGPT